MFKILINNETYTCKTYSKNFLNQINDVLEFLYTQQGFSACYNTKPKNQDSQTFNQISQHIRMARRNNQEYK